MKFALLGDDPAVLPLVRAIVAHPQHALTHAAFLGDASAAELLARQPSLRLLRHWDELLSGDSADAIIVAGYDEELLEGAKKLAAEGRAILLSPHVAQDSTFVYELALIRDDSPVTLFPILPLRVHPHVCRLAALIESAQLGTILHLQMDRELQTAPASPAALISLRAADQALLKDGDLLRTLGGNFDQVTALRSGSMLPGRQAEAAAKSRGAARHAPQSSGRSESVLLTESIAAATVSLAGNGCPQATWSIRGAADPTHWKLTVTGEKGVAVLTGAETPLSLRLEVNGADVSEQGAPTDEELGGLLLERFEAAAAGENIHPDWTDVTRAFEIVDASHRSVKRRRTIDLYFEETSERTIFKTQMTAIGCGVLTFTLLGMLLYLALAGMFDINKHVLHVLRIVWLMPLIVYLSLQFLLFVARPSSEG
jgi:predicted dehydrogenase